MTKVIKLCLDVTMSDKDFAVIEKDAEEHAKRIGIKDWTVSRHMTMITRRMIANYIAGERE